MGSTEDRTERMGHARSCGTDGSNGFEDGDSKSRGSAARAALIMIRNDNKAFSAEQYSLRLRVVAGMLLLIAGALVARAVDLQVLDHGLLEGPGDARYTSVAKLSWIRGAIYYRNGEALAGSMPVDAVWASPK